MNDATTATTASIPADDAPHLLIVDDDRRIRVLLKRYLGDQGYRVTVADSAEEAIACLKNLAFDLIILDVMMPGENGLDLAARLRGDPSALAKVPILMLTARAETGDRIMGFECGVDDFLGKPFEPRELSLRVASICGGRSRSRGRYKLRMSNLAASSSIFIAAICVVARRSSV